MIRPLAVIVAAIASLIVTGCDRSAPTAPTPAPQAQNPVPAAMLTGLVVSSPESFVAVGATLALRASGRYSDGTLLPAQPQWSISPAAAAEISPGGVLTARSPGNVTVTARLAEFEARASATVVPDYTGTWRGPWRRLECFGRRCGQGDLANPTVDLLISQSRNGRELAGVMLFGPWDATRFTLSGRGFTSTGASYSLGLFWLERGPAGERLFEVSTTSSTITVSPSQTLSGRMTMIFTERGEQTRLELTLGELVRVSPFYRRP